MNRRHLVKMIALSPIAAAFSKVAWADHHEKGHKKMKKSAGGAPANAANPKEGVAKNLKYVHKGKEALKDPMAKMLFKDGRNCLGCARYNLCAAGEKSCKPVKDVKKSAWAPCNVIPGKVVSKDGWCISWQAKG